MGQNITAYLADGRHVEVPRDEARDWAAEASALDTTLSLADWFTEQGDENQGLILGEVNDNTRCDHTAEHGLMTPTVLVTDEEMMRMARVCGRRACILDALAWVQRAGNVGQWRDQVGIMHTHAPARDLDLSVKPPELPMGSIAAARLVDADGFVTLDIPMGRDLFLSLLANSAESFAVRGTTIDDVVHDMAFCFGVPHESTVELIDVDGPNATVRYQTNVAAVLSTDG